MKWRKTVPGNSRSGWQYLGWGRTMAFEELDTKKFDANCSVPQSFQRRPTRLSMVALNSRTLSRLKHCGAKPENPAHPRTYRLFCCEGNLSRFASQWI